MVLDSLVFAENRYHLNILTFTLLEPQTWAFLGALLRRGARDRGDAGGMGLAADGAPADAADRALGGAGPRRMLVTSHLAHAWA